MGGFEERVLTGSARVYRSPAESGGVVGAMQQHIAHVAVSEPFPVDGKWVQRIPQLAQFARVWEMFAEEADVRVGDHLLVGTVRYPVHNAEPWPWRGRTFLHLVVQELP